MTEVLSQVGPEVRGIIWFGHETIGPDSETYKALDYLLNGLLTASLSDNPNASSWVILSSNFHYPLLAFIVRKFIPQELESYLTLVRKELNDGNKVLLINEVPGVCVLSDKIPKDLKVFIQSM
jgi:hypothetical protein